MGLAHYRPQAFARLRPAALSRHCSRLEPHRPTYVRDYDVLFFGTDTERDYEEEDNMAFDNTYGTDIHGIVGDANSICPQHGPHALRPVHRSGQAKSALGIGTPGSR